MTVTFARTRPAAAVPSHAAVTQGSPDEMLISRVAGGDHLAMRALFARYRVPLYRWILRIIRNETLAEDLLSDVFV